MGASILSLKNSQGTVLERLLAEMERFQESLDMQEACTHAPAKVRRLSDRQTAAMHGVDTDLRKAVVLAKSKADLFKFASLICLNLPCSPPTNLRSARSDFGMEASSLAVNLPAAISRKKSGVKAMVMEWPIASTKWPSSSETLQRRNALISQRWCRFRLCLCVSRTTRSIPNLLSEKIMIIARGISSSYS